MGFERLEPGEWGDFHFIRVARAKGVRYRCRARFCGFDGRVRLVERQGRTKKAARESLESALADLASEEQGTLSRSDTFDDAVRAWLEDLEALARLDERSPSTVATYRHAWQKHVSPAMGGLRLSQVSVPVVDRLLLRLHGEVGPATARTSRAIISGAMGRAVREGAVPLNPARDVRRLSSRPKRQPRAMTEEERAAWFVALAADEEAVSRDLPELTAFMLATGLRIGEALAVIWSEVDLDTGTVNVTSTLIRVTGQGLIRKRTKSEAGQRPLILPSWCVSMLRRREALGVGPDEPVFGSERGTFRDPRNVSRWLAEARTKAGFDWVTSHVWRKTTASILDGHGISARIIADQLGHSRVSMTQDVYLGRRSVDPRVVTALELVAPPLLRSRDDLSDDQAGSEGVAGDEKS